MSTKAAIEEFLKHETLAVVGVSRSKKKFPYIVYKNLKDKGYQVLPVNPNTERIDGEVCYQNLSALPQPVEGVVIIVPPAQTIKIAQEAKKLGIKQIWIQQGAESPEAIAFCEENDLNVIHHHCVMMFAEPTGIHKLHRGLWRLLGKEPK